MTRGFQELDLSATLGSPCRSVRGELAETHRRYRISKPSKFANAQVECINRIPWR